MKVCQLLDDLMAMDSNAEIKILLNGKSYEIQFTESLGTKGEPEYAITGKVNREDEHILFRPVTD